MFRDVRAKIGQSDLGGKIAIKTSGKHSHWDIDLDSQKIQIKDFDIEGRSLFDRVTPLPQENKGKKTGHSANALFNQKKIGTGKKLKKIPGINADIKIEAQQVLSGSDVLGSGKLHLLLSENALSFERLHLNVPGGVIDGSMSVAAVNDGVEGHFKLDMEKFNYGIIYRYLQPKSSANGLISMKSDILLKGKDLQNALDQANGTIDLAIWPQDIDASILNLWSVNLFLAILPKLSEEKSKLNCATVLLDIENGEMSDELILVDSTKVWMHGNLKVSFPKETVSLVLVPNSKKAKLFSLQAPIRVGGTFNELGARVKPFDLVGAYFSFITSPLTAPVQRAFGKKIPTDASELCGQYMDRSYLQKLKKEIEAGQPTVV